MPLHLLGKKSWNVYAPANIERVKRDEAAAAAREQEHEQRMQEYDAERRIAILRGERLPSPPIDFDEDQRADAQDRLGPRDDQRRKRRKLAGEDDTDRDIRLAREVTEAQPGRQLEPAKASRKTSDAPLQDRDGHFNLFPVEKNSRKHEKNREVEAEAQKRQRDFEDQYTMRFSNAAGRDGMDQAWYAGKGERFWDADRDEVESKDVWGRPDSKRKERAAMRTSTGDPLAFMKRAQVQLKDSERDKRKWKDERDRELHRLKRMQRSDGADRRAGDQDSDLDDFRLDTSTEAPRRSFSNPREHRRKDRAETAEHRTRRSKSPDRPSYSRSKYRER